LHLGTVFFDAVKHLQLCRIEQRPPRLDLEENYPQPAADAGAYHAGIGVHGAAG